MSREDEALPGSGPRIVVRPVSEATVGKLRPLFDACCSTCFCRYWHFEGTKNDWLERCALRPEENARELEEAVRRGDAAGFGVLAFDAPPEGRTETEPQGPAIGWMKVTPRIALPKLRRLPVYRSLDLGPEESTWSIGCVLVLPDRRHMGVATALLRGAEAYARARGGRAIEGYPRRSPVELHDEEAWQGPERAFVALGYEPVVDVAPYPVYRKNL